MKGTKGKKAASGKAVAATTPVAKKKSNDGDQAALAPKCRGCGQMVTEGVRALQCDHCQSAASWKCAECLNMSLEVYDALVNDCGLNLKWFCEGCERNINNLKTNTTPDNQQLDRMMDLFQKFMEACEHINARFDEKTDAVYTSQLESRIRSLEERFLRLEERVGKMDEKATKIEDKLYVSAQQQEKVKKEEDDSGMRAVMEETVDRQMREDREIERRRNNIIVYRIEELNSTNSAERTMHDKNEFEGLCREVFDLHFAEGDVVKMYRLGQKADGHTRPLLVSLKSPEMKSRVMANLRNLKSASDKYKLVGISNDLTPKQRENAKQMVQQAKMEQDAQGEHSENFKFFVVGHFTHPRVIKLKKKQQ